MSVSTEVILVVLSNFFLCLGGITSNVCIAWKQTKTHLESFLVRWRSTKAKKKRIYWAEGRNKAEASGIQYPSEYRNIKFWCQDFLPKGTCKDAVGRNTPWSSCGFIKAGFVSAEAFVVPINSTVVASRCTNMPADFFFFFCFFFFNGTCRIVVFGLNSKLWHFFPIAQQP